MCGVPYSVLLIRTQMWCPDRAGGRLHPERAADGPQSVVHVRETGAHAPVGDVETRAVVRHLEQQGPRLLPYVNGGNRPLARVLSGVLERLQAAEVHGRLDLR